MTLIAAAADLSLLSTIAVAALLLIACAFTFVPLLPGTLFVFVAIVVIGVDQGFDSFSWYFWLGQILLAALYLVIDNVAQLLGIQRRGGSKEALIGGTIGVMVGALVCAPFIGPFAILVGPPLGAVGGTLLGECYARQRSEPASGSQRDELALGGQRCEQRSGEQRAGMRALGIAALISYAIGLAVKLAVIAAQITWVVLVAW